MSSLAIYRLPHEQHCTVIEQIEGRPEQLSSCTELNGRQGFVLAPFDITDETPLLLLRQDRKRLVSLSDPHCLDGFSASLAYSLHGLNSAGSCHEMLYAKAGGSMPYARKREQYTRVFRRFHDELNAGHYQKLVLSRCFPIASDGMTSPLQLFLRACYRYPRLFISLVSTPQSGIWLAATPEILLEGQGEQWRTIALAGTMKLEGDGLNSEGEHMVWSTKNIQEQRYVATYLAEQLKPFAANLHEEGPRTVRAANLVHLRSDFTFTLSNSARVGNLLQSLHPTPAVCGLPKQEAFRFILDNEQEPRRYYSGFMGPLGAETHLYVSLRCMQVTSSGYLLYAGGGLLRDSVEEQEWQETEAKMETMRQCIG